MTRTEGPNFSVEERQDGIAVVRGRKYYVHPALLQAYAAGQLLTCFPVECAAALVQDAAAEGAARVAVSVVTSSPLAAEQALLKFLTTCSAA